MNVLANLNGGNVSINEKSGPRIVNDERKPLFEKQEELPLQLLMQ